MKKHVLILGAGFGGLELSSRLADQLAGEAHVTLLDQNDSFFFGFSKLEVTFRGRSADEVRLPYRDISIEGVEFRQETVTSIDPGNRRVTTDRDGYEADIVVVALGADYAPEATPGFAEGGFEYYSMAGAERLRRELPSFERGRVLIGILGTPFKCPPAPFEGAMLLHEYLTERGVRDAVDIRLCSPMPSPIPVSAETSEVLVRALSERGVDCTFGNKVVALDAAGKVARLGDGSEVPYDLFIGIPVHKAPDVVEASGLTAGGNEGWVKVDRRNLMTPFEGVYALGDVADPPVPRAGVFAENAARAVADDIGARLHGGELEVPYEGKGTCYVEFGGGLVGKVDADFLTGPQPRAPFLGPSEDLARDKDRFAADRRARWFGA